MQAATPAESALGAEQPVVDSTPFQLRLPRLQSIPEDAFAWHAPALPAVRGEAAADRALPLSRVPNHREAGIPRYTTPNPDNALCPAARNNRHDPTLLLSSNSADDGNAGCSGSVE
jgi:hypothetical protein